MIRIGLTACFMYPDPSRPYFGPKSLTYMENDMVQYLATRGVLAILVPDVEEDLLESYLDEIDGIIFQGGSDLAPESYQQEPIDPKRWPGDRYRDQYEFKILESANQRKLPLFGICRGAQLINAWHGGSLYQDLPTQTATPRTHRCPDQYDKIHHPVDCTPGGLLHDLYGKTRLEVNSVHHQGIDSLGNGLKVEARCPDDHLIEAFTNETMEDQYLLGVQWHPEFSATLGDTIEDPQPLLDHFLKAARRDNS